jgi:predicted N-formylglutamate amidohydrolase
VHGEQRGVHHVAIEVRQDDPRWRGWPDFEAEATQNAPQTHLEVMKFYLHQLARGKQRTRLLRWD